MPRLPSPVRQELKDPITLEELQAAVGSAKSGKAPVLDGFTVQYYKLLSPALGPYLVKMLNTLGDSASFHRESLKAIISVIPKDGKDSMQCGSYSPICLLNADLNLFTKILASRLKIHLPSLVHLD